MVEVIRCLADQDPDRSAKSTAVKNCIKTATFSHSHEDAYRGDLWALFSAGAARGRGNV
jgi:hypothetical protein